MCLQHCKPSQFDSFFFDFFISFIVSYKQNNGGIFDIATFVLVFPSLQSYGSLPTLVKSSLVWTMIVLVYHGKVKTSQDHTHSTPCNMSFFYFNPRN